MLSEDGSRAHRDLAEEVASVGDAVEDVWQVEEGDEEEERVGPHAKEGGAEEAGRSEVARRVRVGRDGRHAGHETQPLRVATTGFPGY